jgi:hypothetical protein
MFSYTANSETTAEEPPEESKNNSDKIEIAFTDVTETESILAIEKE